MARNVAVKAWRILAAVQAAVATITSAKNAGIASVLNGLTRGAVYLDAMTMPMIRATRITLITPETKPNPIAVAISTSPAIPA